MSKIEDISKYISIGGLAAGSGVPAETIRNWELRYQFPNPIRLESGHRRYETSLISRLRKIKILVDAGYKPSFTVTLDESELEALLLSCGLREELNLPEADDAHSVVQRWLSLTEMMNVSEFNRVLLRDWNCIGARRFIFDLALPFLREVGDKWETSAFSVAHEHFASEVIQSFLAAQWQPLVGSNHRKRLLLANQEGDLHSLGLQMAAVLAGLHNIEPIYLGPNTPLQDIVIAASAQKVNAVVIGLSAVSNPTRSASFLKKLQHGLLSVRLAFGGNEHIPDLSNIEYIESLEKFDEWCRNI